MINESRLIINLLQYIYVIYIYIYVTPQTFNARLITQAYLVIFDNGGGNLERVFSSARAFEMLSA